MKYSLSKNFLRRSISLTLSFFIGNLLILILFSCLSESALQDPFGDCPEAREAEALDIQVFYSPYENTTYAVETDTVAFGDFAFNFELTPGLMSDSGKGRFPGQAYALSCIQSFNFTNISNISVILTAPFNDLPIGTDISYLLVLPDGTLLDDLRDFKNVASFFTLDLRVTPANFSQLRTQTILFLRDGSQKVFTSNSPYLETD